MISALPPLVTLNYPQDSNTEKCCVDVLIWECSTLCLVQSEEQKLQPGQLAKLKALDYAGWTWLKVILFLGFFCMWLKTDQLLQNLFITVLKVFKKM